MNSGSQHAKQWTYDWQQQLAQRLLPVDFEPEANDKQQAAVLVLLRHQTEPCLLLTERSSNLAQHPGQVSFVGGKHDAQDPSLLATAKREAYEEIGLPCQQLQLLGQLRPQPSRHGLQVSAFVASCGQFNPQLNSAEVNSLFELPLRRLHAEHLSHWDQIQAGNARCYLPHYGYGRYQIWGLTALFLVELLAHLDLARINIKHKPSSGEIRIPVR